MIKSLSCTNFDGKRTVPVATNLPNHCPSCSLGINPEFITGYFYPDSYTLVDGSQKIVWQIYWCPACENLFLKTFTAVVHQNNPGVNLTALNYTEKLFPIPCSNTKFSEGVEKLSPSFVKIYHQAEKAENEGLDEICGIGYRKSLEFLVKDYLCDRYPDEAEKIRSELLGAALNRIENGQIYTLASRATWIGNDETHYIRKHEDSDVEQMKRFINAMVHYIDSELAFREAEEILPKK